MKIIHRGFRDTDNNLSVWTSQPELEQSEVHIDEDVMNIHDQFYKSLQAQRAIVLFVSHSTSPSTHFSFSHFQYS